MGVLIFLVLSFLCEYENVSCDVYHERDNRTYIGCHGDRVDAYCEASKVILISDVDGGTKPSISNCTTTQPECCVYEPEDCLFPCRYAPECNDTYHVSCNGRDVCSLGTIISTLKSAGECVNTYQHFSQYVQMSYYCVEETRIGSMCGNVLIETSNSTVYVQSDNYPETAPFGNSACNCSIQSDSEGDMITIYLIHRALYSETSGCSQTLTVEDGDSNMTFSCDDNSHYNASTRQSTTNYLRLLWTNTATTDGGQFWVGFYAENSNLTLNCPAVPSQYVTSTSTTMTSTTSTSTTTASTTTTSTTTSSTTITTTPTTTPSTTSLTVTSPRTTSEGTTPTPTTAALSTTGIDATSSSSASMVTESGQTSTVSDRQLLNVLVAVTAVIGVLLLMIFIALCILYLRSKTPRKVGENDMMGSNDGKEPKVTINDETPHDAKKRQTSKQRKTDANRKGTGRKGTKSGVTKSSSDPREVKKAQVIERAPSMLNGTTLATKSRDKQNTAKPKRTSLHNFTTKTRTSVQKRKPNLRKHGKRIKTKVSTMELFTTEPKRQFQERNNEEGDPKSMANGSKEPSIKTTHGSDIVSSNNVEGLLTPKETKSDNNSKDINSSRTKKSKGKKRRKKSLKSARTYDELLKIVYGSAFRYSTFFKKPTTSHRKRGS